ncbi:MAG: hypothetical protein K5984_03180 [Bacteroidales bacterium]|nr:hypothetical protein [Bacteroidales bacterium]
MNLNFRYAVCVLLSSAMAFAACSKDGEPDTPVEEETSITITAESMDFSSEGGTKTFYITTNKDWYIRSSNNYLVKVSPSQGEAGRSIAITATAAENTAEISKSATIYVTADDKTENISVTIGGVPEVVGPSYYAPENTKFHHISYIPYYQDIRTVPDSILCKLDYVCFAFATIQSSYAVSADETELKEVTRRCHALGVKVLLCFGGTSSIFKEMAKTRTTRKIFIKSVMALVNKYDLDGVDNDWEWPTDSDGSGANNLLLMQEFSNILHAPETNKILTMAINSGKYSGGHRNAIANRKELWDTVDWFHVMTYDDFANQNYPTITERNHSSLDFLKLSYDFYVTTSGLPASKYLGGIACYGRPSGITQSGTVLTFKKIVALGGDPDGDEAWVTSSSYDNGNTKYRVFYNGRVTARNKVSYMKEKNTGGYFFWELGQDKVDTCSLVRASYLQMMAESQIN